MSLKGINLFDWQLKKLEVNTNIKPFKSSDSDLNKFLFDDAKNYLTQRLAVTYLIETEEETVAYFCLSNDTVLRTLADKTGWKKIKKSIPNAKIRSSYPAVKIGRLAVDKKYESNGFGRLMIQIAREKFTSNTPDTGCRFITVDAKKNALDFYVRNKFDFLTSEDESFTPSYTRGYAQATPTELRGGRHSSLITKWYTIHGKRCTKKLLIWMSR
jgi:predicted GNAT family N-acyltransferase